MADSPAVWSDVAEAGAPALSERPAVPLKALRSPVAEELDAFRAYFRDAMRSDTKLLEKITRYVLRQKGKEIRPLLVLLTAKACGGVSETSYRAAALVELLHTATLVHDDVVDDAERRRGVFSINALWKNKIAVLVGDYLLSRGLLLSVDNGDFSLLRIVSHAVREMSEGELLQIEKARNLDITEAVYYDIIRQKTASLIASCCAVGAASVGAGEEVIERMRLFGEKVGMAFQIKDDLFDYGDEEIGKPRGIDIKERKMTLPLIHALQHASWIEKKRITFIVRNQSHKSRKVQEVIDFVKDSGGLTYAQEVMERYYAEAQELLNGLPDTIYRQSLQQLVDFTILRNK